MTEVAATRPRITKNQPLLIAQIGEMKVSYINEKKLDLQPQNSGKIMSCLYLMKNTIVNK
jgi:hypothetical protein